MTLEQRLRLDGQRALITGSSRGLGREMALALAQAGADLVLVARDGDALEGTAAAIRAFGREVWTREVDVGDPEACEALCEEVVGTIGSIRILINNVGGRRLDVAIEEQSLESWRRMMDLNLTSTFLCSRIIGADMIAAGKGGRIVNVASINAFVAGRGIGGRHYESAKSAVVQFTRTLAVDWAEHGITANSICPGFFLTDANRAWATTNPGLVERIVENVPAGHPGQPEDLGPLAVYLASDAARYVTGASIVIDGGYTCL